MRRNSRGHTFFNLGVVFLAGGIFLFVSYAWAQTPGEGLTLSPPLVEVTGSPGDTFTQKVRITNPTENIIELYPTVMNFRAGSDGTGEPSFYPVSGEDSKYALGNWIYFEQTKLALTPRQVVEFSYEIRVPFDAEPGGHYGTLLFSTQAPEIDENQSQVSISSMVGTLILVKIPGNIHEEGSIESFSAQKWYFEPPVDFTTKVENSGNIHFKPRGDITIRNTFGTEKAKLEFNRQKGNILPDSMRTFADSWEPERRYFFEIPIGKFTAHLHIAYGTEEKVLDQEFSFWIIPWWFIITLGVFLGFVCIGIIWWIVKRSRRKRKNNTPSPALDSQKPRSIARMENRETVVMENPEHVSRMPNRGVSPRMTPEPYTSQRPPQKRRRKIV